MQSKTAFRRATGHITVVEERRFLLLTDDGRGFRLTLAHDASSDVDTVNRWREARTPVVVEYDGEPGTASGVAHAVTPR